MSDTLTESLVAAAILTAIFAPIAVVASMDRNGRKRSWLSRWRLSRAAAKEVKRMADKWESGQ